jgi:hypothetical protein
MQCSVCGHGFSTQFSSPNQTQAFHRVGEGPGAAFQPQPSFGPVYPRSSFNFAGFLLGIPPFCCFLIGFFVHLFGIALIVLYFSNGPTYSPVHGWATVKGLVASVVLGIVLALLFLLFAVVI